MAFTVNDFHDLLMLLEQQPSWRDQLRNILLPDDLLATPGRLDEIRDILAETAQTQAITATRIDQLTNHMDGLTVHVGRLTEHTVQFSVQMEQLTERMDQLTVRMDQLAQRVGQLSVQMDQLAVRMDQLTERMDQLAVRMDQLTERVDQLAVRMDQLTERVDRLGDRVDQLVTVMEAMERRIARIENRLSVADGFLQEHKYRTHPGAYFGKIIRKARVVQIEDLYDLLEATFTDDEYDEVLPVDMIVKGRLRELPGQDVFLAVEVSVVVDKEDVRRADRCAELLRKAGLTAMPVVAGEDLTDGAERQAQAWKVPVLQNGRVLLWDDALTQWAHRLVA